MDGRQVTGASEALASEPLFSLVMGTLGRTKEVRAFLDSLLMQTCKSFEVLIVDQNPDQRLTPILAEFSSRIEIQHLRSERGLSRARNVGLSAARGRLVAFPDDDCWYGPDVLEDVKRRFEDSPQIDCFTGRLIDEQGRPSCGRFDRHEGPVSKASVWTRGISCTVFIKAGVALRIGGFDETLGLGAGTQFGSGEETDFLLRALACGSTIWYQPEIVVSHPDKIAVYDDAAVSRGRSYGAGMGRVLSKHQYGLYFVSRAIARPVAGTLLSLLTLRPRKARYHWSMAIGRLHGVLANSGNPSGGGVE